MLSSRLETILADPSPRRALEALLDRVAPDRGLEPRAHAAGYAGSRRAATWWAAVYRDVTTPVGASTWASANPAASSFAR